MGRVSAITRKVMKANRSSGTQPELLMASALLARNLDRGPDFKVDFPIRVSDDARVRPDFVFFDERRRPFMALFVDGCYWHSCPIHGSRPRANARFWKDKFELNKARDARNNRDLVRAGLIVYRVWECRVRADREGVAARVARAFNRRLHRQVRVIKLKPMGG